MQSNGLLWFPLILSLSKDAAVAGAWFDKLTMSGRTGFAQTLFCNGLPVLGYLKDLTNRDDGIIMTATLLLFPTTAALYRVFKMFFAAKEAAERKARERRRQARERGLQEGIKSGQRTERERISAALEQHGVQLSPELVSILAGEDE